MRKLKIMLPYFAIAAAATFLLPLALLRAGMLGSMLLLYLLLPGVCGACGLLLGKKAGIVWAFAPLCAVAFWLSIPLFYNASAIFYGFINAGIALGGCCVGAGLRGEDADEDDKPEHDTPESGAL